MKATALFAAFGLLLSQALVALEPGDQAPELAVAKFVSGEALNFQALKGKSPLLVEFFASWSEDGVGALKALAQFKRDYAKSGLEVLAISSEDEKDLSAIVAKLPKGCPVALDDKNASSAAYMSSEPVVPTYFLISKDGAIVWKGQFADLAFVLKRFADGKLSVEDSKRVASLRKAVADAIGSKSLNKAIEASDELLKILPADTETVKLRLAMYEMQGNRRQSIDFLDGLIERAPDAEGLYFSRLDVMLHSDPKSSAADIAQFAAKACDAMHGDPEALNNLAWILLDETEFASAPLAIAFKASSESVATLPSDADPDLRAASLDTLARVNYSIGSLDKAIELQSEALELWKGGDDEARCKDVLEYYKSAKALKPKE